MSRGLVVISGATGFIGKALSRDLAESGYDIAVLTRDREKAKAQFRDKAIIAEWDGKTSQGWLKLASRASAIINLAGENIGAGRWTKKRKQRIIESRLNAGRAVRDAIQGASTKPKTIVQASAVGYYGPRDDEPLDEFAAAGEGFLAETVRQWELSTQEVEDIGVRRVVIRSGLVLGKDGGVLPRFLRPFRLFLGGPLGTGKQWFSWVHWKDEVGAIRFLLEREDLRGVFNLVSPQSLTMKEFVRTLGRVIRRPSWFRVPAFLLRLLFGEMAKETLLAGQKVLPDALLKAGYKFQYPEIEAALRDILRMD
jgi:uncharacterized protein (TIGR01777 family)